MDESIYVHHVCMYACSTFPMAAAIPLKVDRTFFSKSAEGRQNVVTPKPYATIHTYIHLRSTHIHTYTYGLHTYIHTYNIDITHTLPGWWTTMSRSRSRRALAICEWQLKIWIQMYVCMYCMYVCMHLLVVGLAVGEYGSHDYEADGHHHE